MILIHLIKHNFDYVNHYVWKGAVVIHINIAFRNAFSGAEKHCITLSFTSNIQVGKQKAYKIELFTVKQSKQCFIFYIKPPQELYHNL
jgi:hypothetical protein